MKKKKKSGKLAQRLAKPFFNINLIFIILVFLFSLLPGAFRGKRNASPLSQYNSEIISFSAFVCQEADLSYKSRRLTLCVSEKAKEGRVLVTTSLYPAYDYGDYLEFRGKLTEPESFADFNYPAYLARYNIFSLSYFPKLKLVPADLSSKQLIQKRLILFKQKLRATLNKNIPEPEAGLASAMIFGYKKSLSNDDLDIFSRVGIRHLIAISGVHVTIFSSFLLTILTILGFSRRRSIIFILFFLVFYPLITGLASSAIRASLMGGMAFLALYFRRSKNSFRLLVISASLMLLFNPMLLRYDLGFQLSFLAILGIIYLEPILKNFSAPIIKTSFKSVRKIKFANFIFSMFNLTLASQLVSWPIMFSSFEQFSLIAPIANIFLIWLLPLILISIILALFLTALLPFLGLYFFFPTYIFLRFIFFISNYLSEFKLAAISPPKISLFIVLVYYISLFYYIRRRQGRLKKSALQKNFS